MAYMEMDLNLIKTFVTVYECKSIAKASTRLFVSQPAVTLSIKRLEEFLGGKLFVRTPKGVVSTSEGEEFFKSCCNALKILDNGIKKISSLSNLESGHLNIGSSSTIIRKILLPFIEKFNKKYPNIIISITDANSDKLIRSLKSGLIDLAIINMPITNENEFTIHPIMQTTDCFIASANNSLDYLTIEQLKQEKLILQKHPSSNRNYFNRMCELNNVSLSPSLEIGSFGLITDFVSKNLGIAYTIKEFVQDDIQSNKIKEVKTNFQIIPRNISILTQKESVNSFVCQRFIDEVTEEFKS